MNNPFESTGRVKQSLNTQKYIASDEIATIVFLSQKLGKPLLTEGPAGVGKTELAKAIAGATGRELIRLQCYEGLDESKALYEWEYSKQLLYTTIASNIPIHTMPSIHPAPHSIANGSIHGRLLPQSLWQALSCQRRPGPRVEVVCPTSDRGTGRRWQEIGRA